MIVDAEYYTDVARFKWHGVHEKSGMIYVIRTVAGERTSESLHRRIMNAPNGMKVDHINGNGLDNRKANLRILTNKDNCRAFKRKPPGCTSKYRGVSLGRRIGLWRAVVRVDDKNRCGGYHKTEEDAARAYNALAASFGFLPEAMNKVE